MGMKKRGRWSRHFSKSAETPVFAWQPAVSFFFEQRPPATPREPSLRHPLSTATVVTAVRLSARRCPLWSTGHFVNPLNLLQADTHPSQKSIGEKHLPMTNILSKSSKFYTRNVSWICNGFCRTPYAIRRATHAVRHTTVMHTMLIAARDAACGDDLCEHRSLL